MASPNHSSSVLGTHTSQPTPSHPQEPSSRQTYTYYHAGPLFTAAELSANSALASQVSQASSGRYQPVLPQDLEQRDTSPHAIRDSDIRALLSCDLALFVYDGAELDSGTVVEYMLAKFADVPAVILRTDFRGAGDQGGGLEGGADSWNLMSSFYPRTERVVVDGMALYKCGLDGALKAGLDPATASTEAGRYAIQHTADAVVKAFDRVVQKPSVMPKELREGVFAWLALMPGLKSGGDVRNVQEMKELLALKEQRRLL